MLARLATGPLHAVRFLLATDVLVAVGGAWVSAWLLFHVLPLMAIGPALHRRLPLGTGANAMALHLFLFALLFATLDKLRLLADLLALPGCLSLDALEVATRRALLALGALLHTEALEHTLGLAASTQA